MKLTVTAIYDRRKKLATNPTDKAPVEIQVYQSQPRLRKYLSTGISIEQAFWDNDKKQVRTKHPNAPHYNKINPNLSLAFFF